MWIYRIKFYNNRLTKFTVSPLAEQTVISHSYQPLSSYLQVTDDSLLNQKQPNKINFVVSHSKLFLTM